MGDVHDRRDHLLDRRFGPRVTLGVDAGERAAANESERTAQGKVAVFVVAGQAGACEALESGPVAGDGSPEAVSVVTGVLDTRKGK